MRERDKDQEGAFGGSSRLFMKLMPLRQSRGVSSHPFPTYGAGVTLTIHTSHIVLHLLLTALRQQNCADDNLARWRKRWNSKGGFFLLFKYISYNIPMQSAALELKREKKKATNAWIWSVFNECVKFIEMLSKAMTRFIYVALTDAEGDVDATSRRIFQTKCLISFQSNGGVKQAGNIKMNILCLRDRKMWMSKLFMTVWLHKWSHHIYINKNHADGYKTFITGFSTGALARKDLMKGSKVDTCCGCTAQAWLSP